MVGVVVVVCGGGLEEGRLGAGLARVDEDGRGVQAALFWPFDRDDAPPRAGKGFDADEKLPVPSTLPQLPWRDTAERDDCAVEDFKRRTLRPPGRASPSP